MPGQHLKAPEELEDIAEGGYIALIHADGNNIGDRFKRWQESLSEAANDEERRHMLNFFSIPCVSPCDKP